eukprot:CAMPEP_0115199342 /NCGR_PEP_ID=MMETSP0270-20121206/16570_1 /TAXON_ID=71861 /ORGANISM="Scrippsiella trochoidea, Strain CCMP3099" /LENGTH=37 /DNA_ID= /DNA_START= /DNA_END= /DNA_ORIENTATION=
MVQGFFSHAKHVGYANLPQDAGVSGCPHVTEEQLSLQ